MPVSELPTSRADDAARLVRAVQEAGAVALKFYKGPLKKWTKGEGDSPVTEADIAANELLHAHLLRPGEGWLSEESENDPARLRARRRSHRRDDRRTHRGNPHRRGRTHRPGS